MQKLKYAIAVSLALVFFAANNGAAWAQTSSSASANSALLDQIQTLLKQVKSLQDQIAALNTKSAQLQIELKETLQLTKSLSVGMTGDEVKLLQQMLASDPEIYPEGLVTGYFGAMTQKAVKKFQAKHGIEQAGMVGPKTLAKLNTVMKGKKIGVASTTVTTSATEGDKVTVCHKPGGNASNAHTLVIGASALAAHLAHGDTVGACSGVTPADSAKDLIAPVISGLASTSPSGTTATISWTTSENATSTIWYGTATPLDTGSAFKSAENSLRTSHYYNLSGLAASTTYYYKIEVADPAGNTATTTEKTVTTQ